MPRRCRGRPMTAITIDLPTPPSKNDLYTNVNTVGRARSKEYRDWIKLAGLILNTKHIATITDPCRLTYILTDSTNMDLGNAETPTTDLLVHVHVLKDDSKK